MVGLIVLCSTLLASAHELSPTEILRFVEQHNPEIAAARSRETAAEYAIGVARSGYFPTIDFEAIDSTGFPGSSGLTGVGGLMGSPYRSGAAYGVVAKQTLWDFGRTSNSVEAAKHDNDARKADAKVTLYQVKQSALRAYYACSLNRSLRETWELVSRESELVAHEVRRFVKTGQRSVVERYLVDAQTKEALTAAADFTEKLKISIHLLAVLTGIQETEIECPLIPAGDSPYETAALPYQSPLISRAQAEADAARSRLDQARANHYPKLVAVGSVGDVEKARLVGKQDYAVAGAVILPLFDGLKTTNEARRSEALASEKDRELEAARQNLDEINAKYDEIINSAKIRLRHLEEETKLAEEAFAVAKKRYLAFQGTLVDLREALRNLSRTKTQTSDARAEYLQAAGAKALVNGAE